MTSYVHKPEHAHWLIEASQPILPGDREREQALLPGIRRPGIQQPPIALLDQPAPDAYDPQVPQTDQDDQSINPLVFGDAVLPHLNPATLPIPEHRLDPHA